MFHIVLHQPLIPPNTGNIIRLCANTGAELHLIHPLGFSLSDKHLKRAGLDYHVFAHIHEYENFEIFSKTHQNKRIFAIETCGKTLYCDVKFEADDMFLFGQETKGLPESVLDKIAKDRILKIPMKENIRSINLSNTAAIVLYEAWRQLQFA